MDRAEELYESARDILYVKGGEIEFRIVDQNFIDRYMGKRRDFLRFETFAIGSRLRGETETLKRVPLLYKHRMRFGKAGGLDIPLHVVQALGYESFSEIGDELRIFMEPDLEHNVVRAYVVRENPVKRERRQQKPLFPGCHLSLNDLMEIVNRDSQ